MFQDRQQAGELLAERLKQFARQKDTIVVGITRGGTVVSSALARKLHLHHFCIVIKKIGAPYNIELALGAIGPKGVTYWDRQLIKRYSVSAKFKQELKTNKKREQQKLEKLFPKTVTTENVQNKTILLVDDGVATGATVLCAVKYFKKEKVKKLILAVPVISKRTYSDIRLLFDSIVALETPQEFSAVGQFYQDFPQIENEEVIKFLRM